jgi:hypothetical protein
VFAENSPQLIALVLMAGLAPVWLLAGLADYACHRLQHIERNAGAKESVLHLLMLAELGSGIFVALFLELTAAAYAIMAAACVAHELTTWVDLAYAESRRRIPWYEQWVHGLQQALPWTGLLLLMLAGAPQALALFGLGPASAEWSLRWKEQPLPPAYVTAFLAASLVVVGLPFVEELARCLRARNRHGAAAPSRPPDSR